MINFNKFSFDKFLESRDKSLYREVRITSAIKTHMDEEKIRMYNIIEHAKSYIIKLIGSDDEKLNIHSHPSLQFLAFSGYGDSESQKNLLKTINLIDATHKMFLSDWNSLSDPSKKESLDFIMRIYSMLASDKSFPVTTPEYNINKSMNYNNGGLLRKRDYVEKLTKHIIDPLTDIEKVLDEWLANNTPEANKPEAPVQKNDPAVMQNKQDAPAEMPNKKDAPAVMPKQGWLSKMFSK